MADRDSMGGLAAQDAYGRMPLSANVEDRRAEPPMNLEWARWISRHTAPIPRLPVQVEDPMAVAAGYNWIGQRPAVLGGFAAQDNYQQQ